MKYQVMILQNAAFALVRECSTEEKAREVAALLPGKVTVFRKIDEFTSVEI